MEEIRMKSIMAHACKLMIALALPLLMFGCGGSSSSSPAATTTVSGSVMAGPPVGSIITVKTVAGTVVATTTVPTDSNGSFSIAIPDSALSNDLVFEASGGTFDDEAEQTPSGKGVTMGTLSTYVSAGSLTAGSNVSLDPSSSIIRKLVAGGMTKTAAEAAFTSAFGYTPDCSIKPAFATMSSASTTTQRLAGLRAAAFSQLTKDLVLTPDKQFDLINAIATDLADGTLDGGYVVAGKTIPADLANRFSSALVNFQMSALNKSKLTPDKIGAPVFNKTALTTSYKVEYILGTMAAAQGKTSFKIKLSTLAGAPVSGKNVTVRPFMYMATKSHTTPSDQVIDNGDGTYSCTAYYVMSSVMNGMSMGIWELKVTIDGTESVYFYPVVAMSMGNTSLTKLTGISDSIMGMAAAEKRTWFLFNDGLTGMAGNHNFSLFLATKETMTNFPAVYTNKVLKNESGADWTVSTVVVEASTDKTNWIAATETSNGHWTVAGLPGLTSGVAGSIYVRLTVNGEQKTTDGAAVGAANAYQTFTVTPGM
jgi:hypothetical protein